MLEPLKEERTVTHSFIDRLVFYFQVNGNPSLMVHQTNGYLEGDEFKPGPWPNAQEVFLKEIDINRDTPLADILPIVRAKLSEREKERSLSPFPIELSTGIIKTP